MRLGAHPHTHKHTQMKTQKSGHTDLLGAVARPFERRPDDDSACNTFASYALISSARGRPITLLFADPTLFTLFARPESPDRLEFANSIPKVQKKYPRPTTHAGVWEAAPRRGYVYTDRPRNIKSILGSDGLPALKAKIKIPKTMVDLYVANTKGIEVICTGTYPFNIVRGLLSALYNRLSNVLIRTQFLERGRRLENIGPNKFFAYSAKCQIARLVYYRAGMKKCAG
ncbi:hypothetical protein EVAR_84801_1 [Eumeta japonica]|uniref:Uncharacterized protein n=1 Tax=Eumeta variegata TaxID=151549 RepID=A0A4C1U888_EUMVA|nr:hypothetical protein EVAR_84801_1 [Eumeta japonica]